MEIVYDGDVDVKNILGKQKQEEFKHYELAPYCVVHELNDGILLLNNFTKELLYLSTEEKNKFLESKEAIEEWFLVENAQATSELVETVRETLIEKKYKNFEEPCVYTIFTTTACNADCSYCFERKYRDNSVMSLETAEQLVEFICRRKPEKREVRLVWFGGEPLLNTKVIDYICSRLKELNFPFYSMVASNGFLFTQDMINRAVDCWNLKRVQITLDGTEDVYNSVKKYSNVKSSPFRVVVNNIKLLLDAEIRVNIRLNVNYNNGEDLLQLAKELDRRFGMYENLHVYVMALNEKAKEELFMRTIEEENLLRSKQYELFDYLYKRRLYVSKFDKTFKVFHCSPDEGCELQILPDGKIGWCSNYIDSDFMGHISSLSLNEKVIHSFKKKCDILEQCVRCPIYPQCIRLEKCDYNPPWCTEWKQKIELQKLKYSMLCEFNEFQKIRRSGVAGEKKART